VDVVAVEVAAGTVVVLGGSRIGVSREYLVVTERDPCVKGVGDRRMSKRVRADVTGDASGLRDPQHHPVDVAAVDRRPRLGSQDQRSGDALTAAGLQNPQDRDGQRHSGGLVALAHQVQHPMASHGFRVVLDSHRSRLGRAQRVDALQVGQRAVVNRDGLGDLKKADQFEPV
jgi:hypothetical protein